jgi:hypothetical protein
VPPVSPRLWPRESYCAVAVCHVWFVKRVVATLAQHDFHWFYSILCFYIDLFIYLFTYKYNYLFTHCIYWFHIESCRLGWHGGAELAKASGTLQIMAEGLLDNDPLQGCKVMPYKVP